MDVPETHSLIALERIRSYRSAVYEVGGCAPFQFRIDQHCAELAALMVMQGRDGAAFLTAWNPYGRLARTAENETRQRRLIAELQGNNLLLIEGFGRDPANLWPGEPSVLVLGLAREASCEAGLRHHQNAVVWAGREAVPRLLLLR